VWVLQHEGLEFLGGEVREAEFFWFVLRAEFGARRTRGAARCAETLVGGTARAHTTLRHSRSRAPGTVGRRVGQASIQRADPHIVTPQDAHVVTPQDVRTLTEEQLREKLAKTHPGDRHAHTHHAPAAGGHTHPHPHGDGLAGSGGNVTAGLRKDS
jgi:hypothetical protein